MVNSMTGFASLTGQGNDTNWAWEIRSVNNKGFDLRQRLPDGCDALEKPIKDAITKRCGRGTIYVSLKAQRDVSKTVSVLNKNALNSVISAANEAQEIASAANLTLDMPSVIDLLSLPGVMERNITTSTEQPDWVVDALSQLDQLADNFADARAGEGAALDKILGSQLDVVNDLIVAATASAANRGEVIAQRLYKNVRTLIQNHDGLDETRLEQELALLAVKNDITEELDRLRAHVEAARALLGATVPIGRKFDFLMQEFNREANTLCSKSGSADLTRIGLDLKTTIDQMREQVQNVE